MISPPISSPVVDATGKTRFQESLERANARKGPSVGQWLTFPGYTVAKTVATLGEDWVLIDCEHGNIDDSEMYIAIAAVASSGVSPVVRVPGSEPWMFKRALDAGAHAVMVPMCETKEQAEAIVKACKYPSKNWPGAYRGCGAMFTPGNFNQTALEYLHSANDNIMICVQIETQLAIENVEAIAAVKGIDALFVGPVDLACSMGYVGFDHASIPEVQEASKKVLDAAKAAGKYAGHFVPNAQAAAQKYNEGWDFVNCGTDLAALASWMSNEMASLQKLVAKTNGQIADKKPNGVRASNGYS